MINPYVSLIQRPTTRLNSSRLKGVSIQVQIPVTQKVKILLDHKVVTSQNLTFLPPLHYGTSKYTPHSTHIVWLLHKTSTSRCSLTDIRLSYQETPLSGVVITSVHLVVCSFRVGEIKGTILQFTSILRKNTLYLYLICKLLTREDGPLEFQRTMALCIYPKDEKTSFSH